MASTLKKIGKLTLYIVGGLIGFVLLVLQAVGIALQFSTVQTWATGKATAWLEGKIGTSVRIARVDLDLPKTLVIEGIYLEDHSADTLLYAGHVGVDIGVLALTRKEFNINQVELRQVVAKLRKPADKDTFNFQYIVNAFASTDTSAPTDTSASPWTIDAEGLRVADVRFVMDDKFNKTYLATHLGQLDVEVETLGLQTQHPEVSAIHLNGLRVTYLAPPADTTLVPDTATVKAQAQARAPLNPSGWGLTMGRLSLRDVGLRYEVAGAPRTPGQFNYERLDVQDLSLLLADVEVGPNNLAAKLQQLALAERNSGFMLANLAADAEVRAPAARLTLHEARTPRTRIGGVVASVRDMADPKGLLHALYVQARFGMDSVHAADVALFAPLPQPGQVGKLALKLQGGFRLDSTTLQAQDLRLAINPANQLRLDGMAYHLTDIANLRLSELRHTLRAQPTFVAQFLPQGTLPPEVFKLGPVRLEGQVSGTLSGLAGRLEVQARPGTLTLDRYYYRTDTAFSFHEGAIKLHTIGLNPAVVLGPQLGLGPVTALADLAGGYKPKGGPYLNKGQVQVARAVYNRYTYRNVRLDATYLAQVARARLRAGDPNLQTDLRLLANLRMPLRPTFKASGTLEIDPRKLHFLTDTLRFRTRLDGAVTGTDLSRLKARLDLRDMLITKPGARIGLDSLLARITTDSGRRVVSVQSEVIQARMAGQFDLATIGPALSDFLVRYIPLASLPKRRKPLPPQDFRLTLAMPANPKAIEALVPGLHVPQPMKLDMRFNSRRQRLDTDLDLPYLRYQTNMVSGLRLTTDTDNDNWRVSLKAATMAADSFIVPEPALQLAVKEGDARFRLKLAADEADSRARIGGRILGIGAISRLTLNEADLSLKGQKWELNQNTRIEAGANHLLVQDFRLQNEADTTQAIEVESPGRRVNALQASIRNIQIADVLRLLPTTLPYQAEGLLNVRAQLDQVFTLAGLRADLRLDSMKVNGNHAGTLRVEATQPQKNVVGLAAMLSNYGADLQLKGRYNMANAARALDFRLTMDHYQPQNLAPILSAYITKWTGDLSADITVAGSVDNPQVGGYLAFNGKNILQPAFTQVPYQITDQRIAITRQVVRLDQFTLADEAGKTLRVDGTVGIANLTAPQVDLRLASDKFHLLNTTASDNSSFYGEAYITTDLSLTGPATALTVNGQVETEEGTRITYNLESGEPGTAGVEPFIIFYDSRDSTTLKKATVKAQTQANVSGLGLALNIKLQKGTRFMVIIDPSTGDRLECEGTADLRFAMRPTGDINLQGDYNLTDGFYSLNLAGLVSRRFNVRSGSRLSWRGDPANAQVDLTAVYTTKTARFPLVADQEEAMTPTEIAAAKRREPVSVLLRITNTLLQPEIKFDLEVPETSAQATGGATFGIVAARIQQIQANENEVNKQALGLIALNRFVTNGEGGSGATTADQANEKANQTVSDVLTQQLSNLGQEFLGGVEINVNIDQQQTAAGASTSFADKQVGVSVGKSFANERLRVSVGGQVSAGNSSAALGSGSTSGTPMLGDLTAEYRLDKKGELNAKFFRTYNQTVYTTAATERIGASLQHNKNFSSFRRLFWSDKKREAELQAERKRRAQADTIPKRLRASKEAPKP